jgi:hypothetical protein
MAVELVSAGWELRHRAPRCGQSHSFCAESVTAVLRHTIDT